MDYNIGDIVKTKKQHPCGSKEWEVTRVGVDFKLKCIGCGHVVMLPREKALKALTAEIIPEEYNPYPLPTHGRNLLPYVTCADALIDLE